MTLPEGRSEYSWLVWGCAVIGLEHVGARHRRGDADGGQSVRCLVDGVRRGVSGGRGPVAQLRRGRPGRDSDVCDRRGDAEQRRYPHTADHRAGGGQRAVAACLADPRLENPAAPRGGRRYRAVRQRHPGARLAAGQRLSRLGAPAG